MSELAPPSSQERAIATVVADGRAHRNGLYLGRSSSGSAFAPSEHGVLVLGPPRSGKTSSIVIPNVLQSSGSVLAVSTKRDLLDATYVARQQLGSCLVFDPSGTTIPPDGVERIGWSPLDSAGDWDRAVLTAESMVGASRSGDEHGASRHWTERASALLAALFHGAALHGSSMRDLVRLVNRSEPEPLLTVLARRDANLALDLLSGILATDSREQSGIWSTASGVLAAYRTASALQSAALGGFDAKAFIHTPQTLYLVAPSENQQHLAPIVAGVVRDIRSAAYQQHRTQTSRSVGSAVQAPVVLVLDELANIAPLHDLPTLVAEGASQGVLTLACLQDLSQARQRWGVAAEGFLSLFGTKLVLGGLGDERTLRSISALAGEYDVPHRSVTKGRPGLRTRRQRSTTTSTRRQPRLSLDAIAQLGQHEALAIIGARPTRISLTPYYASSPWREASNIYPPPPCSDRRVGGRRLSRSVEAWSADHTR